MSLAGSKDTTKLLVALRRLPQLGKNKPGSWDMVLLLEMTGAFCEIKDTL